MNRNTYHTISGLGGTIARGGSEYDWEVPDHLVVASPGGVDATHHDVGKGFYGGGYSSVNKFAGPEHVYGDYGNMYAKGPSNDTLLFPEYSGDPRWYDKKEGFDLVDPPDNGQKNLKAEDDSNVTRRLQVSHPLILLGMIVLAYFAMNFFSAGVMKWVSDYHEGEVVYYTYFLYSAACVLGIAVLLWFTRASWDSVIRFA